MTVRFHQKEVAILRRNEMKVCKKCKTLYRWDRGGVVMTPQDYMDKGLCEKCRKKQRIKILGMCSK